jgi:hypothetical protein
MDEKILANKYIFRLIARYFKFYPNEYKILVNAGINLQEGQELKRMQMQAHHEFIDFKKKLKTDRIKAGKEGNGDLFDWRLSLTLSKYFEEPTAYNIILNTKVNQNE